MRKFLMFLLMSLFSVVLFGQIKLKPGYYAVFFSDKNGDGYSLSEPQDFLSQAAIERRRRLGIKLDSTDLPVSRRYLDSLRRYGFKIRYVSKWLNGALLEIKDSMQLVRLDSLVHVWNFLLPNYDRYIHTPYGGDTLGFKVRLAGDYPRFKARSDTVCHYGVAGFQNHFIQDDILCQLGYTGKGVKIAVLDAGFWNLNKLLCFDSLWVNHQILGWYDFVDKDTTVFNVGDHGTMVMSVLAGNIPGFKGMAPKADYYLFRTEDENSEYKIEEFNWLVAAERADSLGVDIISSSLGYNRFDDSTMNYTYSQMDGMHSIASIAARMAADKGIIVVISAGNEGDNSWHYITVPADADSVLTVGAVNPFGLASDFSSYGPTYDKRIKPDVCALGCLVTVVDHTDSLRLVCGTSFSAPSVAGLVACLRQAFPNRPVMDFVHALQMTASSAHKPNKHIGYGIARGYKAFLLMKSLNHSQLDSVYQAHKAKIFVEFSPKSLHK